MTVRWALLLALLAQTVRADTQAVVLTTDDAYPPYSYVDAKGELKGFYVDIARAVGAEMPHYRIEFRALPWRRALEEAEAGVVAGVLGAYWRPRDRPWMSYSDPFFTEVVVVVCNRNVASQYRGVAWPSGFAGARFGNNLGFATPGSAFFALVREGRITLDEAFSTSLNLRKLVAGRIDCYSNARGAIAHEVRSAGLDPAQIVEVKTIAAEKVFLGYHARSGKGREQKAFIAEFNATFLKLRAEGRLPPLE